MQAASLPIILPLLLVLAAAVRIPYIFRWDIFFNADYALMNLVGLHFMKGEFSLYLWGQNYHAAVEPIFLAALFKLFAPTPAVAAIVPALFSAVFLVLYHYYLQKITDRWTAAIATLLLCVPAPFFISVASMNGDYSEILCLGMVHLILFQRILQGVRSKMLLFMFGLAAGFSWFYLRVILLFWLALLIYFFALRLESRDREAILRFFKDLSPATLWNKIIFLKGRGLHPWMAKTLALLNLYIAGNLLAAAFLWLNGPFIRMAGDVKVSLDFWPIFESCIKLSVLSAALVHWKYAYEKLIFFSKSSTVRSVFYGFLLGYSPAIAGMMLGQFPDSRNGVANAAQLYGNFKLIAESLVPTLVGEGSAALLTHFSLALGGIALIYSLASFFAAMRDILLKGERPPTHFPVLCLGAVTFGLGISYDRLVDPSTLRYFFPLYLGLAFSLALLLKRVFSFNRWLAYGMLFLYLANSVDAHLLVFKQNKYPNQQQVLSEELERRGVRGGYANYWIAYYLTSISAEKIIIASTEEEDRHPPYLSFVRSLDRVVYLGDPRLAAGSVLQIKGVSYKVAEIDVLAGTPVAYLDKIS